MIKYLMLLWMCLSFMAVGAQQWNPCVWRDGGIIATDTTQRRIALVFTAAEYADGSEKIQELLDKHQIKGSFFFTGEFFETYPETVGELLEGGHYVGSHSYGHLLYMPWEAPDSLLISYSEFVDDMHKSFQAMAQCGITRQQAFMFLPPYEYYNARIAAWAKSLGLQLVNFTPGSGTNADYTIPSMGKSYRSSKQIYERLLDYETKHSLNGHILLVHFGTSAERTDKFYDKYLEDSIIELKNRGYEFWPLWEMICIE